MTVRVLTGDALAVLATLPAASAQTCITSPPYYGLRDYGTAKWDGGDPDCNHRNGRFERGGLSGKQASNAGSGGDEARQDCGKCGAVRVDSQIGLEPTPEEYVAKLVSVFREVRRVLRDDGTLFLNLGDSYYTPGRRSSGGCSPKSTLTGGGGRYRAGSKNEAMFNADAAGQRAGAYGTSGTAPEGSQAGDCLCGSLCGACRAAYRLGISRSANGLAPTPGASPFGSSPAHTESASDHLPTSDCGSRADHSAVATQDSERSASRVAVPPLDALASTPPESSRLSDDSRSPVSSSVVVCLLCARSFERCALASAGTTACRCDTESQSDASGRYSLGIPSSALAYPNIATASLKPKDLIGIPWRVAFALQADGWYLRSDIIWHKPNPMPESVTDRPTKSHEYLFLLTKAERYYYDADAIREPDVGADHPRNVLHLPEPSGGLLPAHRGIRKPEGRNGTGRNRRSVWTVATQPFSGVRLGVRGSAGDNGRTTSPSCPIHGDQPIAVSTDECGEQPAASLFDRTRDSDADLDLTLQRALSPIQPLRDESSAAGSSDWLGPVCESPATDRSSESRKTDRAPSISLRETDGGISQPRIGDSEQLPDSDATSGRTPESSNAAGCGEDAMVPRRAGRTAIDSGDKCTCKQDNILADHFAVFPPALIEPCVLAGSARQACETCGAPWERAVDEMPDARTPYITEGAGAKAGVAGRNDGKGAHKVLREDGKGGDLATIRRVTTDWRPTCACETNTGSARSVVLDPFSGAGTTGLVADRLGRDAVLIELNPAYAALAAARIRGDAPLFADVEGGAA